MKTSNRFIAAVAAALALGAGGLAFADGPGGRSGPDGGGMGAAHEGRYGHHMRGMPSAADVTARLATLKTELGILPTQETAWLQYEAVVRQQADARRAMFSTMKERMQDPKTMTDAERSAFRDSMKKQRDTDRAARDTARQALYAVLLPEQKTLADKKLSPRHGHRHHGGPDGDRPAPKPAV